MTRFALATVIHDNADDLERLLASVERFLTPLPRVVAVDSGSRDRGPEVARQKGADLLVLDGNRGFGAGCNAALERICDPVTVLVNPDVELLDDGLASLAAEAAATDALLAPRLLNADGSVQDSAHPPPGTLEALIPAVVPYFLFPPPVRRRYQPWRSPAPRPVGWAVAACLVARTDLLRRLGPFDPDVFLFYEDMDLCLRAADAGVPTVLRPDVALRHTGGASVGRSLRGRDAEMRARRRREVMAARGGLSLALDDTAQALTFGVRAAGRGVLRRGGAYEREQLRALRAARRDSGPPVRGTGRRRVRWSASTPGDAPVVIDARAAARRELGGVERVTREMAARLPRLRPDRYAVMSPPPALAQRAGHVWEQALLPVVARKAGAIYCPANISPAVCRRSVLVIHDLASLRHPEWYSASFATYHRHVLPLIARRARRVIVPSEFSRREVADGLGLDAERIAVVHNGVDERFSPSADSEPVRRVYGLDKPYVLLMGTRIARKNLAALAEAARRLRELGIGLVSAGSTRHYTREGRTPPMQALGYVDDRHLPGLYTGAVALAMPSLYEGFGLPALEAMASGVPVVASNRTALPETCGSAALLVDPDDEGALADALMRLASDEGLRRALVTAGLERSSQFSWDRAATATDAVIGGVLAEHGADGP
jgi:glycosyltransferase involved in cell wall biosynthesis/GT2 family glycosyltransferase